MTEDEKTRQYYAKMAALSAPKPSQKPDRLAPERPAVDAFADGNKTKYMITILFGGAVIFIFHLTNILNIVLSLLVVLFFGILPVTALAAYSYRKLKGGAAAP